MAHSPESTPARRGVALRHVAHRLGEDRRPRRPVGAEEEDVAVATLRTPASATHHPVAQPAADRPRRRTARGSSPLRTSCTSKCVRVNGVPGRLHDARAAGDHDAIRSAARTACLVVSGTRSRVRSGSGPAPGRRHGGRAAAAGDREDGHAEDQEPHEREAPRRRSRNDHGGAHAGARWRSPSAPPVTSTRSAHRGTGRAVPAGDAGRAHDQEPSRRRRPPHDRGDQSKSPGGSVITVRSTGGYTVRARCDPRGGGRRHHQRQRHQHGGEAVPDVERSPS